MYAFIHLVRTRYARIDKLRPPVTCLQCPTRAEISDLYVNAIFMRIVKKLPIIKQ